MQYLATTDPFGDLANFITEDFVKGLAKLKQEFIICTVYRETLTKGKFDKIWRILAKSSNQIKPFNIYVFNINASTKLLRVFKICFWYKCLLSISSNLILSKSWEWEFAKL